MKGFLSVQPIVLSLSKQCNNKIGAILTLFHSNINSSMKLRLRKQACQLSQKLKNQDKNTPINDIKF